jgi:NADH dehydrogenase FAD-containing subunit
MAEEAGCRFIEDRAVRVDATEKLVELAGGQTVPFDVLSVSVGSLTAATLGTSSAAFVPPHPTDDATVPQSAAPAAPFTVLPTKPIARLCELPAHIRAKETGRPFRVVIAGGGAAAVEIAANLAVMLAGLEGAAQVTVVCGRGLLQGFGRLAAHSARKRLADLGVEIRIGDRVVATAADGVVTTSSRLPADLLVAATGVVPSALAAASGLPVGPDGSMAVNENLNVLGHTDIFGGGDSIWFTPRPLDRAGVYAVREAGVLKHNVIARLVTGENARLRTFKPQRNYVLILNLGGGIALFSRKIAGVRLAVRGRLMWQIKDRVDRAFMGRFGSEREWLQARNES